MALNQDGLEGGSLVSIAQQQAVAIRKRTKQTELVAPKEPEPVAPSATQKKVK